MDDKPDEFGVTRTVLGRYKDHVLIRETYDLKHPRCPLVSIDWLTMERRQLSDIVDSYSREVIMRVEPTPDDRGRKMK